jgi:hypothetical protein
VAWQSKRVSRDFIAIAGSEGLHEAPNRLTEALQRISVSETGVDLSQAGGISFVEVNLKHLVGHVRISLEFIERFSPLFLCPSRSP